MNGVYPSPDDQDIDAQLKAKLHSETATIVWSELQRFFAQGSVLQVDSRLDLVQVAVWFAQDIADKLQPLVACGKIAQPSNDKARQWYDDQQTLWSVVVAPFVLVQEENQRCLGPDAKNKIDTTE